MPQATTPRAEGFSQRDHPDFRPNYRPDYRPGFGTSYGAGYGHRGPSYGPPRPVPRPYYSAYRAPYYRGSYGRYGPYYTFQPRVRVSFGLWIGFPVSYPYGYAAAYPPSAYSYQYPYPPAYPYSAGGVAYPTTGSVAATTVTPGGLSFEISPVDADVVIDGQYLGTVGQFSPDQPPLWLTPGRHRVEIREPGYETIAFDVDIIPGQVIPYQGDLQPY